MLELDTTLMELNLQTLVYCTSPPRPLVLDGSQLGRVGEKSAAMHTEQQTPKNKGDALILHLQKFMKI